MGGKDGGSLGLTGLPAYSVNSGLMRDPVSMTGWTVSSDVCFPCLCTYVPACMCTCACTHIPIITNHLLDSVQYMHIYACTGRRWDCGWKDRAQPGEGQSEGAGLSWLDGKGILHPRAGRKAAHRLDHSEPGVNRKKSGRYRYGEKEGCCIACLVPTQSAARIM